MVGTSGPELVEVPPDEWTDLGVVRWPDGWYAVSVLHSCGRTLLMGVEPDVPGGAVVAYTDSGG